MRGRLLTCLLRQRIVSFCLRERVMMWIRSAAALSLLCSFGVLAAHARPLTPAEQRSVHPYSGALPVCEDSSVLQSIASRFQEADREYWNSGLQIIAYENVRETGYRSNGLDFIPKRYCNAAVQMSDGRTRLVRYAVGENLGVIGWGWGVEWCIIGLDRNLTFGGGCRTAGP